MRSSTLLVLAGLSLAACAAPAAPTAHDEPTGVAAAAIIGGTQSSTSQDAVILIAMSDGGFCSGTLIAPNLVLTARHCVSNINEQTGAVSGDLAPSSLSIATGVSATPSKATVKGKQIFHDTSSQLDGHDLGLILLEKDVPGAKVAPVRFTPPTQGESTVAVGYGDGANGQPTPGRYQRSGVQISAVGPSSYSYKPKSGSSIAVDVPSGDFATTESTCFGDSGGPLFDGQGRVIGVTSRGVDDQCIDRPSIFTSTAAMQKVVTDALEVAQPGSTTSSSSGSSSPSDEGTSSSSGGSKSTSSGGGDGAEDDGASSSGSSGKKYQSFSQTNSCAAGGAVPAGGLGALGAAIAVALTAASRRRRSSR